MSTIYRTVITGVGDLAEGFLEHNMFITFKDNAPQELVDYCFIHDENNLVDYIEVNDILQIDGQQYLITGVGSLVNDNLRDLGHITYKFSGETDASIAGTLYLEKKEVVPLNEGSIIKVIRN
ncbi:PTS sorbose transporter subunit IIB [Clostridium polyendosporum]|uniref:PTS sorbose transporter subunit IIB n=1 Tax=Clostridium polyendosporum TaxID=69208 RepID=A0A919S3F4_9CLOT|nr:PTS glucitol/sorbitol transporter subunit IIA [Clostridium polyendosporum]GIM30535.1 PTS sorbose transporter subunit IIB [Clostridium polyendosporum]